MIKIRNLFNYVKEVQPPLLGVSATIPDKSMTISEIMLRFARGMPLGGRPDVYYDEDNEFDTEKDYDLVDLQEFRMAHDANYKRYKDASDSMKADLDKKNQEIKFQSRLKTEGYVKKDFPPQSSTDV